MSLALLESRSILRLKGVDGFALVNNLATNDKEGYCNFLSPQGRVLFGALVARDGEDLLLELDKELFGVARRHLSMYSLRLKVRLDQDTSLVPCHWMMPDNTSSSSSSSSFPSSVVSSIVDTRLPNSRRIYIPSSSLSSSSSPSSLHLYDMLKILHGCGESSQELVPNKSVPLECNLDVQGGVNFSKGCYLGQELIARAHFNGVIRKRLFPVLLSSRDETSSLLNRSLQCTSLAQLNDVSSQIASVPCNITSTTTTSPLMLVHEDGTECGRIVRHHGAHPQLALSMLRLSSLHEKMWCATEQGEKIARAWPLMTPFWLNDVIGKQT